MGNSSAQLNPGVEGYGSMVYSLAPSDIRIPMNGSVDITAKAGVVPEPRTPSTLVEMGVVSGGLAPPEGAVGRQRPVTAGTTGRPSSSRARPRFQSRLK